MIYIPFGSFISGVFIGMAIMGLANDYIIVSKSRYERLREKAKDWQPRYGKKYI